MSSFYQDPTTQLSPTELDRSRKAKQARINALLSTGPTTAEGKAKSSRNAIKHGFASVSPVIQMEDEQAFEAHVDSYMERFQPADQVEGDVVRRAAWAMWKLDRLVALEASLFGLEYLYHEEVCDGRLGELLPIQKMTIAMKEASNDKSFDLCRRYISSATREHDQAIRTFYLLESKRRKPAQGIEEPPQPVETPREPNEPTRFTAKTASVTPISAKTSASVVNSPAQPTRQGKKPAKVA